MEELKQLLRYEVPGLMTLVYFLLFLYFIIPSEAYQPEVLLVNVAKILPGLTAFTVVLALPVGVLLYQIYIFNERENFLENREGMKVIPGILERYAAETDEEGKPKNRPSFPAEALRWWNNHEETVERNEYLDMIFYSRKDEKDIIDTMERFQNFYHSKRVIGIYSPIVAALLAEIIAILVQSFSYRAVAAFIIILVFVFVSKSRSIWNYIDGQNWIWYCISYCFFIGVPIYSVLLLNIQLNLQVTARITILSLFIFIISATLILPTRKNGSLRKEIDELERNVLLHRKREVFLFMQEKTEFEGQVN
jgi:hypothetical protein